MDIPKPLHKRTQYYNDDHDTWTDHWWFNTLNDEQIALVLQYYDITYSAGRPGSLFRNEPVIVHYGMVTRISQRGGWDI